MFGKEWISKEELRKLREAATLWKAFKEKEEDLNRKIKELTEIAEHYEEHSIPLPPGVSVISFIIDKNLKVTTKTKINKNVLDTLVENEYILPNQIEDEGAINIAFIALANDVTDQIISDLNEQADLYEEFIKHDKDDQTPESDS